MLTKLDDTLRHQAATTFDHVISSDPRWFDRHWFCAYHPEGEVGIATGLAVYTNMNVLDGYACVIHDGKQRNLRFSREFRPDVDYLGVGPLHYEIVEGLKRIRLTLDENQSGTQFDIVWEGVAPAHEENYHFRRVNGRILEDYMRFDQVGCAGGSLIVGAEAYDVEKLGWWGIRDHSWGIRPGMGGPQNNDAPSARGAGTAFYWMTFRAGPYRVYYQMTEDASGNRLSLDGLVGYLDDGKGPSVTLTDVEQELEVFPGTDGRVKAANITFIDENGRRWPCRIEKLSSSWDILGWGYHYGYRDGLGLGARRGEYLEESDVWDVSDPENVVDQESGKVWKPAYRENAVRVTFEGETGGGEFAHFIAVV